MKSIPIPFVRFLNNHPKKIFSNDWEDRQKILDRDINLFCWTRQLQSEVYDYSEYLLIQDRVPIKGCVNRQDLSHQLLKLRKEWDADLVPSGDLFWNDVFQNTYEFLDFSDTKCGTLHLKIVKDDACRKFHTDGYRLRLFTTYIGLGTEWLPESAVNRKALGDSNNKIVRDPSQIKRIETGHVAILKGEIPGKKSRIKGIVHRSPPIQNNTQYRLILRVDLM